MGVRKTIPVGTKKGRLTVIDVGETKPDGRSTSVVECECGEVLTVGNKELNSGNTVSCGCAKKETAIANGKASATHGLRSHPLYSTWQGMRSRTQNPNNSGYADYGGRGIRMHEPWIDDARACIDWLMENLGPKPDGMTIHRIRNNEHYEPGNLMWADDVTQANWTRWNRYIGIDLPDGGVAVHTLAEWSRMSGVSADLIGQRLDRLDWEPHEAIFRPSGR